MATMKDVAKLAKVSTSTVSHVLNSTRYVSPEIKKRVLQAMEELHYTPSALARSLKKKETKTLGMLISNSTNPFYAEVIKGVERCCYLRGYNLILCNTENSIERMQASLEMLLQKQVDGLFIMCKDGNSNEFNLFERYEPVPTVVMDWGPNHIQLDQIQDNSFLGGLIATQHLIDMGHKNIGCITGPLEKKTALLRLNGFKACMDKASLPINNKWIVNGNFTTEGGFKAFEQIFNNEELPSALFVSNDIMAMGVINAAYNKSILIPNNISVIGYDDIKLAKFITPSLTTIHQPKFRLGAAAVELLLDKIHNKTRDAKTIQLTPTLVIRDSVQKVI